jgi:hypothetical protein
MSHQLEGGGRASFFEGWKCEERRRVAAEAIDL